MREPGSPYLAGSSATLDGCLRNVMQWLGYGFATAFAMARAHPLAVLGQPPGPARGDVAEFVRWRRDDDGWYVVGAQVGPWAVDA
ncbi:hypothetical protein [Shumkonia mesophila]|uniref:hypothetical protein n=1 Tax=Shumkonia mesophila TaxID=2838854 RepID=UPI0029341DE2|nr:hypothetical protein [Shumkonia mesophila]